MDADSLNPLDLPTEQSVKRELSLIPSWQEWLVKHGFKHETSTFRWNATRTDDVESYRRHWMQHGRGWKVLVQIRPLVLQVWVFNNPLRYGKPFVEFEVSERNIPVVVGKIIREIERKVTDQSKKRRLNTLRLKTPKEPREDVPEPEQPVVMAEAVGPIRQPIPDDPNDLKPEQMDRMLDRLQRRCFPKGTRVRVTTQRNTRLNGEMGTVVDAGPHACYVAIDSYVEAGDPDPFRFEEDELTPVYESKPADPDDPGPYLNALDYITPLTHLGYKLWNGQYVTHLLMNWTNAGYLRILVYPRTTSVQIVLDYRAQGEMERLAEMNAAAIDTLDRVREIEQMAAEAKSLTEFLEQLVKLPNIIVTDKKDHLYYLFGESMMEPDDPLNPEPYIEQLAKHAEVINAFRAKGVRMRRRMTADRPHYEMFWIPNAVTDVSYDLFLAPGPEAWEVTARGQKEFHDDRHGDFQEDFDINDEWTLNVLSGPNLQDAVDDLLYAITRHQGPEEPTPQERDWDDIDESADEINDPRAYAIGAANWNPVQMLTAKDLRKIVREAGFRVGTIYKSRVTHGWTINATPATGEAFEVFQQNPHRMPEIMMAKMRDGIVQRLPELGKITRGQYVLDQKLEIHCWEWNGSTSADPTNPNNWTIYVSVQPIDWQQRVRGGGKVHEGVDDPPADVTDRLHRVQYCPRCLGRDTARVLGGASGGTEYWKCNTCGDKFLWSDERSVGFKLEGIDDPPKDISRHAMDSANSLKAIEQAGYIHGPDHRGTPRWNKYWTLPQPLTRSNTQQSPTWELIWGSPDPWGQFVYGIQSKDHANAIQSGYIIVRPVEAPGSTEGWDYATSVRRMLLKVEQVMRNIPKDTADIDVVRNYLHQALERVRNEVNAEADKTIIPENVNPDDPSSVVGRARRVKMGDLVDVYCPRCRNHRQLFKNWPDDTGSGDAQWGTVCQKCGGFIPAVNFVLDSVPVPPEDDINPTAYAQETLVPDKVLTEMGYRFDASPSGQYWFKVIGDAQLVIWPRADALEFNMQVYEYVDGVWLCRGSSSGHPLRKLRQNLVLWEQRLKDGVLFAKEPGAMVRLTAEGIDDPTEVLAQHKPRVYGLYGQYANYDAAVPFSTYTSLEAAVDGARVRNLHAEYDHVWAEECEADSLENWDSPAVKAVRYTGVKYRILPDYSTEKVIDENPDGSPRPPRGPVAEGADDPEEYVKTTYDHTQFLQADGWRRIRESGYHQVWGKDFPLPQPYTLGGMTFTKLMPVISFDPHNRGAFAGAVDVHWADAEERSFGTKGWTLERQLVYPERENEERWEESDYNMPVRRFARGIGDVLKNIRWPENNHAVLHVNSNVEAAVGKFVKELNDRARVPLYPNAPLPDEEG